jgi:hypothetical protein
MDPMTYRTDCGGEKFFRNATSMCGDIPAQPRPCHCGPTQNSHTALLAVFGAGTSLIPAPTVSITSTPGVHDGGTVQNRFAVQAQAGSKRGVRLVEMYLNGYKWIDVSGAAYLSNGQPNPGQYTLTAPAEVPDGVIDIQLKAYDDLNLSTTSSMITVTKGVPCTSAATCATGQTCGNGGRCFWAPPTGNLGDKCTYPQFCISGLCKGTSDTNMICTQQCTIGTADACPAGYDCLQTVGASGACYPKDNGGGGCCSVSGGSAWVHGGLGALILGIVLRRRRR